jgi:hypothetical protein
VNGDGPASGILGQNGGTAPNAATSAGPPFRLRKFECANNLSSLAEFMTPVLRCGNRLL